MPQNIPFEASTASVSLLFSTEIFGTRRYTGLVLWRSALSSVFPERGRPHCTYGYASELDRE